MKPAAAYMIVTELWSDGVPYSLRRVHHCAVAREFPFTRAGAVHTIAP